MAIHTSVKKLGKGVVDWTECLTSLCFKAKGKGNGSGGRWPRLEDCPRRTIDSYVTVGWEVRVPKMSCLMSLPHLFPAAFFEGNLCYENLLRPVLLMPDLRQFNSDQHCSRWMNTKAQAPSNQLCLTPFLKSVWDKMMNGSDRVVWTR